jgi:hypothetical protein
MPPAGSRSSRPKRQRRPRPWFILAVLVARGSCQCQWPLADCGRARLLFDFKFNLRIWPTMGWSWPGDSAGELEQAGPGDGSGVRSGLVTSRHLCRAATQWALPRGHSRIQVGRARDHTAKVTQRCPGLLVPLLSDAADER